MISTWAGHVLSLGGVGAAAPISNTLYHGFETVTGSTTNGTLSQHTGSRKVQGAAGVHLVSTPGGSPTFSSIKTGDTTDLSLHDKIIFAVDVGDQKLGSFIQVRPKFQSGGAYAPWVRAGAANGAELLRYHRGRVWVSFNLADIKLTNYGGESIQAKGTTAKSFEITVTTSGARNADVVLDAAVLTPAAAYKPAIIITCDDMNTTQHTNLLGWLSARGLVANIYALRREIGQATKLTLAQIAELRAAGWGICLDADGGSNPITAYTTVADMIASLNSDRDWMIANGVTDADACKHLCYSFGRTGHKNDTADAVVSNIAVTANGTDVITLGTNVAYSQMTVNDRIFGGGLPATLVVTAVLAHNQVRVNQTVASGSYTGCTRTACSRGLSVTCNGTTTITLTSTTNLFAGMEMLGYTVPANTTIVSVDSGTQITVSNAVPATCTLADFALTSSEWWHTNVGDQLIAAGYNSARTVEGSDVCTAFGIDKRQSIFMPGLSLDTTTATASHIADIQTSVVRGRDRIVYLHNPQAGDLAAHWGPIFDAIQAEVVAGRAECLTLPQWWAQANGRVPPI